MLRGLPQSAQYFKETELKNYQVYLQSRHSKVFPSFRDANPVAVIDTARLVVVIRRVFVPPQVGHLG